MSLGLSNEKVIVNPSFPGGQTVLDQFIQQHIVYPEAAIEEEIETSAKVVLQLDDQGDVIAFSFPEPVEPSFQKSIVQLVEHMPNWIPAKVDGKPVRAKINLSIQFALTD